MSHPVIDQARQYLKDKTPEELVNLGRQALNEIHDGLVRATQDEYVGIVNMVLDELLTRRHCPAHVITVQRDNLEYYGEAIFDGLDNQIAPDHTFFVWGDIIKVHEVGDYQIVEYHSRQPDNVPDDEWASRAGPNGHVMFSCYLNNKAIGRGANTLDSALTQLIAYRHDGNNSRAGSYFLKMIGATE